jgi:HPt (histidine-containing phosphotransfer) domain-containing protein
MDPEVLAEFTGGDESLRREILLQFIAADDADAANLREKFGNTDLEGIAQVSHRIKGASNMIGAKPYARAAERLNRGARTGDLVEVEAGIVEFEYQRELLNQLLQEATAPG